LQLFSFFENFFVQINEMDCTYIFKHKVTLKYKIKKDNITCSKTLYNDSTVAIKVKMKKEYKM